MEWIVKERPGIKAASSRQYSEVFNNQCDIGFYVPKKDQCNMCTSYKINEKNITTDLENQMNEHNKNRQACRDLKENDKKNPE